MNKAEQAQMEALRVRCALAWPPKPPVPVDVRIALEGSGAQWLHLWWSNIHRGHVGQGVTDGHLHATEEYSDERLANLYSGNSRVSLSQTSGGPWYATKADALAALHYAVAARCASDLRNIERMIEDAAA